MFARLLAACLLPMLLAAVPLQAATLKFTASLSGPAESPPNVSPGTGFARVTWNDIGMTMRVEAAFSDLLGTVTAAHIHGPTAVPGTGTAGVITTTPTFPGFPAGVTSGTYDVTFDLLQAATYNPLFLTSVGGDTATAAATLLIAMQERRSYFNIHSTLYPGGEIRGFLAPIPVPAGLPLLLIGLAALGFVRRRG